MCIVKMVSLHKLTHISSDVLSLVLLIISLTARAVERLIRFGMKRLVEGCSSNGG